MRFLLKDLLPDSLLRQLRSWKGKYFDSFSYESFAQEGEDMILRRIFDQQDCGFYVDVGAHHPKRFSNTYFFYKAGWNGINIDAMPGSMALFNKERPRDINLEKPISSKKQKLTYYAFNEPALNGFSREVSEVRDGFNSYRVEFTKDLETTTLEEVLSENLIDQQVIDFLSVDVEGLDFDVIRSINLDIYKPRVIVIEILDATLPEIFDSEIFNFLVSYGYSCYAKSINSVIFKSGQF